MKGAKVMRILTAFLVAGSAGLQPVATARAQGAQKSSVLPSGGGQALLDPSDTVILLLDHQSGLFQTVKDISITELRNNTVMLERMTTLLKIPVITTASEPDGPNGPLMPEIHQYAPHAQYVGRAVLSEVHRTWNRPEAAELAKLYALVAPNYAEVIGSYLKAQEAAKQQKR
jgi:hypothetical protein